MLTLQQDVVCHMKVTRRAAGVPTAQCSLIGELHLPHSGATMQGIYDRLARTVCLCPVALTCSHQLMLCIVVLCCVLFYYAVFSTVVDIVVLIVCVVSHDTFGSAWEKAGRSHLFRLRIS